MKLLSLERLKSIKLKDLFSPSIVRFIWSAILDNHTCPLCLELDGQILDPNSPEYTIYQPPLHPDCRCTIIPIKSDASVIPDINFEKPDSSWIIKYAPFWFLIPDKEKSKNKIIPIDPNIYDHTAPELFYNPNDLLSVVRYIRESETRREEGDYEPQ